MSFNAPFTRQYSSLHDGVDNLQLSGANAETAPAATARTADGLGGIDRGCPAASSRASLLAAGADTTPAVRPFAETLVDRGWSITRTRHRAISRLG